MAWMCCKLEGAPEAFTETAGIMACEFMVAPTEITSGAMDGDKMVLKAG